MRKIERFSNRRRVEGTGDQQRVPGHQNSIPAPLVNEQRMTRSSVRNTPQSDRRPANRPRKRQGGVDTRHRRRSSTHVVESPSKALGYSITVALDAEATAANLGYDRSNKLTGGNEEAALPQREETLQPHSRDNGRMGDKKRPHITPPLTPSSPANLPIPQADRGRQRPCP